MSEVTGRLNTVLGQNEIGIVQVALCGYGSRIPRNNGVALFSRPQSGALDVTVQADGTFSMTLAGNDIIVPANTYYTVSVTNSNGDVVQINAYQFLDDQDYDLDLIDPYDPNSPPLPLPPQILNQLLIVPETPQPPNYPGDQYTSFYTLLTEDCNESTASGMLSGNLYTFILVQDEVGGHAFNFPASFVLGPSAVNPDPYGITIVTFVMGIAWAFPIANATWVDGGEFASVAKKRKKKP